MYEVKVKDVVVARHVTPEDIRPGLNFFSEDSEFIQVGAWNYDGGRELPAHIHNVVDRTVNRTCEALYVISGSLEASIFDLDEKLIDQFQVRAGEILLLLACGHGYRILQDDTRVVEIKNGPYLGADTDRRRI